MLRWCASYAYCRHADAKRRCYDVTRERHCHEGMRAALRHAAARLIRAAMLIRLALAASTCCRHIERCAAAMRDA